MKHFMFSLAAGLIAAGLAASGVLFAQSMGGLPAQSKPTDSPAASRPAGSMPAASASAKAGFAVEGIVVDKSGRPLAGAKVRTFDFSVVQGAIKLTPLGSMTTAADGRYSFKPAPRGTVVRVVAEKDGLAISGTAFAERRSTTGKIILDEPVATGGRVVDDAGKPVAGAKVHLSLYVPPRKGAASVFLMGLPQCEIIAAVTDGDGKFLFKNTPPNADASFVVTAAGKGFEDTTLESGTTGRMDALVTLSPEARIEGVLKAREGGAPIAGAAVVAEDRGRSRNLGFGLAVTDKDGRFAMGSLTDGDYTLSMAGKDGAPADWFVEAQPITLTAGQTRQVALEAIKGGRLEVVTTDKATGEPMPEVTLDLDSVARTGVRPVRHLAGYTGRQGKAAFRVPPGEYGLRAGAPDAADRTISVQDGKTASIELKLKAVQTITGVVKGSNGKPAANVAVYTTESYLPTYTDQDGRFSTRPRWNYEYHGDGSATVRDFWSKPGAMLGLTVRDVERGLAGSATVYNPAKEAMITLAKGVDFRGTVVDSGGKGIKGAKVWVRGGWTHLDDEITTDDNGRYELADVPAGTGWVFTVQADDYTRGEAAADGDKAVDGVVTVEPVKLGDARLSVSGVVKDEDGKPVAHAVVYALSEGQKHYTPSVYSDKNGKFIIKNLPEGLVNVSASVKDGSGEASAVAGKTDVDITIRKRPDFTAPAATTKPEST